MSTIRLKTWLLAWGLQLALISVSLAQSDTVAPESQIFPGMGEAGDSNAFDTADVGRLGTRPPGQHGLLL